MLARIAVHLGFCLFCSATLLAQLKSAALAAFTAEEFPIVLQQSVTAGKTPVGTKIQAKLEVATLVNGTVLPRNAVFSGQVIESAAKTPTTPSRLAILMDSVQWKNGSAPIRVYMTAWYYPPVDEVGQNLHDGLPLASKRNWNGVGQYPDPNSPAFRPSSGVDSDGRASVPNTPSYTASNRRVLMSDVESERDNEGAIALVSRHFNIKLDKLTTYVLASADLLLMRAK